MQNPLLPSQLIDLQHGDLHYPNHLLFLRDDTKRDDVAIRFMWPTYSAEQKQSVYTDYSVSPVLGIESDSSFRNPQTYKNAFVNMYLRPFRSPLSQASVAPLDFLDSPEDYLESATLPYIVGREIIIDAGLKQVELIDFRSRFTQLRLSVESLTSQTNALFRTERLVTASLNELEDWRNRSSQL